MKTPSCFGIMLGFGDIKINVPHRFQSAFPSNFIPGFWFDFYNVLIELPSNLNPNPGINLCKLAGNKENDSN